MISRSKYYEYCESWRRPKNDKVGPGGFENVPQDIPGRYRAILEKFSEYYIYHLHVKILSFENCPSHALDTETTICDDIKSKVGWIIFQKDVNILAKINSGRLRTRPKQNRKVTYRSENFAVQISRWVRPYQFINIALMHKKLHEPLAADRIHLVS